MTGPISRAADLAFGTLDDPGPVDLSGFLGDWVNTVPKTERVRKLLIQSAGDQLSIRIWGAAGDATVDWGTNPAEAFACTEENGVAAAAINAIYDFGFMRTSLQLRLNKGILPMMLFTVFLDDSGRSNYFTREFFRRADVG